MRLLVLSIFNTNKNKKVVKTKIYLPRVVYTEAKQALDKLRKFVKDSDLQIPGCLHGTDESMTST